MVAEPSFKSLILFSFLACLYFSLSSKTFIFFNKPIINIPFSYSFLSLVIKSTLKEGNNPQRIIVQTYNYDISTGKKLALNEVLEAKGISTKEVNKKIELQVTEANKNAEALSDALANAGQTVYKRDVNNAMYVTDNVNHFFVGLDGQIYIVYPYGNSNFTSEMDIIKV